MTNDEQRARDHESDPAHSDELGHEWVDEGGASHLGPATHLESGHASSDAEAGADGTGEPSSTAE